MTALERSFFIYEAAWGVLALGGFLFLEGIMTKKERKLYRSPDELREVLKSLKGMKFRLDCGHHVTFGFWLGNDITIRNGKEPVIVCSLCGY